MTVTGTNFGATQGFNRITFNGTAGIPSSWNATSIVVAVPAGAATGNVVVTVGGVPSNAVSFVVIGFVQVNSAVSQIPQTTVTATYTKAQSSGNLNVVVVGWNDSTTQVNSVIDSQGNPYVVAVGPTVQSGALTQLMYYANNITGAPANGNTVTVTFSAAAAGPDVRIAEYSGIDPLLPVDVVAAAQGSGTPSNSGSVTTGNANDLLVGANTVSASTTTGPGSGYTRRVITTPDGDILEDSIATTLGTYGATAPVSGGGEWIMQMVAFRFASSVGVTSPSITSLSPASGPAGAVVTISGTNFGATQGASTVSFNGIAATVSNWGPASMVVSVPVGATTGPVVVTVGGVPSTGVSFTVLPTPSISGLSPATGPVGAAVTITGSNFGAPQGASTVSFNGIAAAVNNWGPASIVASVPVGAATGPVVVTVGGVPSTGTFFTVLPTPSITGLSPASGPAGAVVTISGTNFGATQGASTVSFNGIAATVSNWGPASIVVSVPAGAATGPVVVTVGGVPSTGLSFAVLLTPSISGLSPATGPAGTAVTISGSNFGATQGTSTVSFNGIAATVSNWGPVSIVFSVPAGAATGLVVVTVGGVPSTGVPFAVLPTPSISGLSPATGPVGAAVTITGGNFGAAQGASTVSFNGIAATVSNWGPASIVVSVPAGAATGPVVVTVGGVPSTGMSFTVLLTPSISGLSPATGPVGAAVTITGSNFGAAQGASTVSFNGIAATVSNWGPGSIVVSVPVGAATGPVVVTVGGVPSTGASFTVLPTPSISGLSPATGPVSAAVTISGSNFGAAQGASTVSFNGIAATVSNWGPGSIAVSVPAGTTTGPVVVTVGGVPSTGTSFTVLPTPSITGLSPATGPVGAAVTITGSNFGAAQGASSVSFNGIAATVSNWGPASMVVSVPVGATTGPVVVTVGGAPSTGVSFTVLPTPSISGLSPATGPAGTAVTISGSNFGATQGTSTVSFNGIAATVNNWNATSIVAVVPVSAATGPVVVTVGGVPSSGAVFTVPQGLSISSVSPTSGAVGTKVTVTGTNFGTTQGFNRVTFNGTVGIPSSWSATNIVVAVPKEATSGNVVVTVGGVHSNGVSFTVGSASPISFVQVNSAVPQMPQTTLTATYTQAQTSGNLNVVVVGWNDSTTQVNSVTDSQGNPYVVAVGPTVQSGALTQLIYYAKNIQAAAANGNTVTVTFNAAAVDPDIRIAEYSGIDPSFPVDVVAAAQGIGTSSNTGSVTTGNANDLLVGANTVSGNTTGPGSGYTSRVITNPDGDILEDSIVTAIGTYSATAPTDGAWIMQMVAFRAAGSGGGGTSPTPIPPVITTQLINQTVLVGRTATFTVAVTGSTPYSYQWQKNGSDITGATLSTYTTPPTIGLDNGAQFAVAVSAAFGTATSSATLTVITPPAISSQPTNQTVVTGQTATFTVVASGSPQLTYQWQLNGVNIPGAISQSYTTPPTTLAATGESFTVIVGDVLGNVPSSAAVLNVTPPVSPATYYVDFSSGSDTNSGVSKATPWQYAPGMDDCSSNCAAFSLNPGDRVIFKGGVTWDNSGFPMVVSWSGSPGVPIYYGVDVTWFAGNSWSRPVFDLSDAVLESASVLASSVSFVTFDNLEIKNEQVDSVNLWPPRGSITVAGGANVTIQNCYIHGWSISTPTFGSDSYPSGGIAFYNNSSGGVVQNCVLDGSPFSNSGTGIYGGTTIQNNALENLPTGIWIPNETPGLVIAGNQLFNVTNSIDPYKIPNALYVSSSGTLYNNIIHDTAPGAFAVYLQPNPVGAGDTQEMFTIT